MLIDWERNVARIMRTRDIDYRKDKVDKKIKRKRNVDCMKERGKRK